MNIQFFLSGNISLALETTIEILKLDPDHVQSIDNKEIYENLLAEEGETSSKRENQYEEQEGEEGKVFDNYQKLCRGELKQDPKLLAKLKCQYVTNKSAFLKIAPFKTEEANLTPYIVVYHDVIYDREIAKIKQLTRKKVTHFIIFMIFQRNFTTYFYFTINSSAGQVFWIQMEIQNIQIIE